jgi:hypothetical protein
VARDRERASVLRDSGAIEHALHTPTDQKSLADQVRSRPWKGQIL